MENPVGKKFEPPKTLDEATEFNDRQLEEAKASLEGCDQEIEEATEKNEDTIPLVARRQAIVEHIEALERNASKLQERKDVHERN